MSRVLLTRVVKKFGDFTALKSLDLEVKEGEFLTLLGPSGCGKTTTLRLIAGFLTPTSGTILLGDEDVTRVAPQHREIGMVFQDYALFPHLTISDNIGFGLQERGYPKDKIRQRVDELLDLIQLPEVHDRYPSEVSGGQQQRIAVARAVAYPPRVMLMDEPLGALDLKLREAMQVELRRIQQELGITTVYVTHDQTEAMNMSDTIVVMNLGEIEQMGSAEEIYNNPKTSYVANFVGQVNTLPGRLLGRSDGVVTVGTDIGEFRCAAQDGAAEGSAVMIAIRPESIRLESGASGTSGVSDASDGTMNRVSGTVSTRRFAGNLVSISVSMEDGSTMTLEDHPRDLDVQPGEQVTLAWRVSESTLLTE